MAMIMIVMMILIMIVITSVKNYDGPSNASDVHDQDCDEGPSSDGDDHDDERQK